MSLRTEPPVDFHPTAASLSLKRCFLQLRARLVSDHLAWFRRPDGMSKKSSQPAESRPSSIAEFDFCGLFGIELAGKQISAPFESFLH